MTKKLFYISALIFISFINGFTADQHIYETDSYSIIQTKFGALGAGDVGYIHPGVYRWMYRFESGGSSESHITITAYDSEDPPLFDLGIYEALLSVTDTSTASATYGIGSWPGGYWGGGADLAGGGFNPASSYNSAEGYHDFEWCASSSGSGEYFMLKSGANCSDFDETDCPGVQQPVGTSSGLDTDGDRSADTEGTAGSLTAGQWDYSTVSGESAWSGSTPFSTYYVRLDDDTDPDSNSADTVQLKSEAPHNTSGNWAQGLFRVYDGEAAWIDFSHINVRNVQWGGSSTAAAFRLDLDDTGDCDITACEITYCGDGIKQSVTSGNGTGVMKVSQCDIHHNGRWPNYGNTPNPGGHNVYTLAGTFILEFSYLHDALEGQNLHLSSKTATIRYCFSETPFSYHGDQRRDAFSSNITDQIHTYIGCVFVDSRNTEATSLNVFVNALESLSGVDTYYNRILKFNYCTFIGESSYATDQYYLVENDADGDGDQELYIYNCLFWNIYPSRLIRSETEWEVIDIRNNFFNGVSGDYTGAGWYSYVTTWTANQFGGSTHPFVTFSDDDDSTNDDLQLHAVNGADAIDGANSGIGVTPSFVPVDHDTLSQVARADSDDIGAYRYITEIINIILNSGSTGQLGVGAPLMPQ